MAKTIKQDRPVNIPLRLIHDNPINSRSMDAEDIRTLSKTIEEDGMLDYPIVYKENDESYVLLSGHRRVHALREMGVDGNERITCKLKDKPADEWYEQELLTKANIRRSTPEELEDEIRKADQVWNTMPQPRKEEKIKQYKEEFAKKYKKHPEYIADPKAFTHKNFRARLDYIRELTCVKYSNSHIKRIINKVVPKEDRVDDIPVTADGAPAEVKPETKAKEDKPSVKQVRAKDILKAAQSLSGLLKVYEPEDEVESVKCDAVAQELSYLIEFYKGE